MEQDPRRSIRRSAESNGGAGAIGQAPTESAREFEGGHSPVKLKRRVVAEPCQATESDEKAQIPAWEKRAFSHFH